MRYSLANKKRSWIDTRAKVARGLSHTYFANLPSYEAAKYCRPPGPTQEIPLRCTVICTKHIRKLLQNIQQLEAPDTAIIGQLLQHSQFLLASGSVLEGARMAQKA